MANTATRTTATFVAKGDLRLVRENPDERIVGSQVKPIPGTGLAYQFSRDEPLTLRVGEDLRSDAINPETGEVVEQDAVEWLRSHAQYGQAFFENEPVAPDPTELLGEIGKLAVNGDIDRLAEIVTDEMAEHNREPVITTATEALRALEAKEPARAEA